MPQYFPWPQSTKTSAGAPVSTETMVWNGKAMLAGSGGTAATVALVAAGSTVTISATYTKIITGTAAQTILTLPTGMALGVTYTVKDGAGIASTYPIVINYDGTHLIDGNLLVSITSNYDALGFVFDGTGVGVV